MLNHIKLLAAAAISLLLVGCASTTGAPADPIEGVNRATFAFNDAVDKAVLTPVARGYQAVTPQFVRTGVSNAFGNVGDVGTSVNNLLQGKPGNAVSDVGRVLINTTLGILGLFDVATPMGLEKNNEDFGQTLGKWGVPSGPYVVLPLLGPSTLRDTFGRFPDRYVGYSRYVEHVRTRNVLSGVEIIQIRADLLAATKTLDEASLDKYQFTRDAFLQRRLNQVHDGKVPSKEREKLDDSLEPVITPSAPSTPATPAAKPAAPTPEKK
jgi:phospholipid-binding lipoprotein MlaA